MSTHNIGFYEDLTKIIFELSSNIIKYAPYFFCWKPFKIRETASIINQDKGAYTYPFGDSVFFLLMTSPVTSCKGHSLTGQPFKQNNDDNYSPGL